MRAFALARGVGVEDEGALEQGLDHVAEGKELGFDSERDFESRVHIALATTGKSLCLVQVFKGDERFPESSVPFHAATGKMGGALFAARLPTASP